MAAVSGEQIHCDWSLIKSYRNDTILYSIIFHHLISPLAGPESSPQPCAGTEALSLAHMRDYSFDGREGRKGQLDLVRLGLEEEMGFLVQVSC